VAIHPDLRKWLMAYKGGNETHFVPADIRDRHKAWGWAQKCVQKRFGKWRKATKETSKLFEGISFHCLRHAFVSELRLSGASRGEAQLVIGHANAEITDVYTDVEALRLFPVIEKLKFRRSLQDAEVSSEGQTPTAEPTSPPKPRDGLPSNATASHDGRKATAICRIAS
jgi:integrase